MTTNGDNKGKPPNITDTHPNHIPYTHTIPQIQTSDLDYRTHDNKRQHTTAIFTNDKSKPTQSTKTTEDNMAKKDAKKTEQENESKFYF